MGNLISLVSVLINEEYLVYLMKCQLRNKEGMETGFVVLEM